MLLALAIALKVAIFLEASDTNSATSLGLAFSSAFTLERAMVAS
jgi:hypothetical protein